MASELTAYRGYELYEMWVTFIVDSYVSLLKVFLSCESQKLKFYWRIWLSFWLLMVMLSVLAVGTWYQIGKAQSQSLMFSSPNLASVQLATEAQLWLEQGGDIKVWLAKNQSNTYGHLLIFDDYGVEISGDVVDLSSVASDQVKKGFSEGFRLLLGPEDQLYSFLMLPHEQPSTIKLMALYGVPSLLIVGGLLSGIISYFLAKFFAEPLKQLQLAGQRVARGELDIGLTELIRRDDEVGDVARDIELMLARLKLLINKQETLLRDISHELRSPLARLNVANDLAQMAMPDSAHLKRIEVEVGNMEHLIDQLITLTRLKSEVNICTEWLNLSELVTQVVDKALYESQLQNVQIHCQLAPNLMVQANRELVSRAFENILRNAIFHAGGDVTVSLAVDNIEEAAESLLLTVLDNGPGVPESILPRLSEPFVQVHAGRSHGQHSGLGLSIARSSIELHKGQLIIQNRTGMSGLSVSLSLPING